MEGRSSACHALTYAPVPLQRASAHSGASCPQKGRSWPTALEHCRASRCGRHQPCQQLAAAFTCPQHAERPVLFHIHAGAGASGPPPANSRTATQTQPDRSSRPVRSPPPLVARLERLGQLDDLADRDGAALVAQREAAQLRHHVKLLHADGLLHGDARNDHCPALHVLDLRGRAGCSAPTCRQDAAGIGVCATAEVAAVFGRARRHCA